MVRYDYSKVKFKTRKDSVIIGCGIHGYFTQKAGIHLSGSGCQKCNESRGEKLISEILDKYNIKYIREYKIPKYNKYRYDFFLPDLNILIEYDGIQHFKSFSYFGGNKRFKIQKIRDCNKNKIASKNKIKLIRISYLEYNNLETILTSYLIEAYDSLIINKLKGTDMIVFLSDWKKYPGAIVDVKTSNKSFYMQAIKYKIMGIKNHAFLLSLLDSSLQGVDPHDEENLTRDQKDRIVIEVMNNPWYFFREVLRVPATGSSSSMLVANRGNIALFYMFFCHIFIILIQIRQTGKSLNTDGLKGYALFFGAMNIAINFLTNNTRNRIESVERIKMIEKCLPSYLRSISSNDICNTERIHIRDTNNKYETAVAQAVLERAKMVFRGTTSPLNHIDEFAYIFNLKESLSSMLKSGNSARDQAAANNSLYGTILSTTAGYKDTPHGAYAFKIYKSGAIFTEKMFDCEGQEELESMIRNMSPEKKLRVLIEMNHRQLGKTDIWLAGKIEETASEGNDTLTDFFNVWVSSRGKDILSEDDIKRITSSKLQNFNPEISPIEGYTIRWYISDEERTRLINSGEAIVAGIDSSEAIGIDDISLVLIKVSTGEVIGAADFNETNITVFGEYITELLIKYPNMTLIVERRSTGGAIIDTIIKLLLQKDINPLLRLFNWVINDRHLSDKHRTVYKELMYGFKSRDRTVFDRYKSLFGYSTSGGGRTSRTKIYGETLTAAVKYTGSTLRDITLINQLLGLKEINGRIDHDKNEHDDMVIGWLLSFWVLKNANNISDYGIDPGKVLTNVKDLIFKDGKHDMDRALKIRKHNDAMDAISKLSERIKGSENLIMIRECKQLMQQLSKHLDYSITPSFNIDIHIANLEKDKQARKD